LLRRKLREVAAITMLLAVFILLATSCGSFSVEGASIAKLNYFPYDKGTYESIDYLLMQVTAVNTNTSVSVSVDGGPLIPLTYQGIKHETSPDDTVARDWHTWQTNISAITASGNHTFQFFSHYYVWQEADGYWAEFNAQSDLHSFTIADLSQANLLPSPSLISTEPTPTSKAPLTEGVAYGAVFAVVIAAGALIVFRFTQRHASPKPLDSTQA